MVLGPGAVHVVGEHEVRLARFDPRRQNTDPQVAGAHLADNGVVLGRCERPLLVGFHGAHELVRD